MSPTLDQMHAMYNDHHRWRMAVSTP